ncbi:IS110 family RNA-guided transposase [Desulfopila aestuarii]|uniref:Transposase IS116/IS110/IS902 family protein n=1 Tax=Desulfopila aestuarii DSM 18488 TaxID=1121416 RepID=A0A1M7YHN1_9BACT|nr:Transposase IS116/IS110/IS902 family protein [Desulfopila aestuarii DSM 18488]
MRKKSKSKDMNLPQHLQHIHAHAAGIDIGSKSHFVSVPEGSSEQAVREFASFTDDLQQMADWLIACSVTTVAVESTGIHWIPVFEILESKGLEVKLVNARHVKNVPGRKSDILDCQWLQRLHTYGLLEGAFRPPEQICTLRGYVRQRMNLVRYAASHVQHMQKALAQMNLQLANVVSNITGKTGMQIIKAILAGERDPLILAGLRDQRCKNSEETIARSLHGNYRPEHLFSLKQAVDLYDFYQGQIVECDREILAQLATFDSTSDTDKRPPGSLEEALQQMTCVDLTEIDGIDTNSALKIIAEIGLDMSRWKSAKHFASWLGLCPGTKVSGGKILSGRSKQVANRAAATLRMAAFSLFNSKSALGAYLRRQRSRLGAPKAITATAHKLARLVYSMLKHGTAYVDIGQDYYEERYRSRVVQKLKRKAQEFGYQLIDIAKTQPETATT